MALNAPLEIPLVMGFTSKKFELGRFQQISPGGGGMIQTIERGTPVWVAEYSTPPLRDDRYDESIAFLMKLEGSMESFLAYDPRRIMPRAYQHLTVAADPWTLAGQSAPRVTAVSFNVGTLTLDRMATGAIVTMGDYISYKLGLLWYLHRVVAGGVVSGTNTIVVHVRPRPDVTTGLPVNIRYRKASAQMKMMGGYQEEDTVETYPSFTFKAIQLMDRSTS